MLLSLHPAPMLDRKGGTRRVIAQELHWEIELDRGAASVCRSAPGLSTIYRIQAILVHHELVHCFTVRNRRPGGARVNKRN